MDRHSNADRVLRSGRRRRAPSVPEGEWGEETTAVYRPDPGREGPHAWLHGQSLDAVFERARRIGVPLQIPFLFSLYVQACAELAGAGRRPARHKEDKDPEPELGPDRIYVGFDGQVKIDWAARDPESDRARRSYHSPEQLRGLPTNGRADLFSLALTIAELFVLKRLSDGRGSINDSEGGADFAEMLRVGTRIPRDLGSMLLKSLALDVEQRPFGVTSLMEDLDHIGHRLGLRANPAITANHMRRIFFEPPTRVTPPPPPPPVPVSEPILVTVDENFGNLEVFEALPQPVAAAPASQLLPPPPPPPSDLRPAPAVPFPDRPSRRDVARPTQPPPPYAAPPAPPPVPVPRSSPPPRRSAPPPPPLLRPRPLESEPPPALARTLPPVPSQLVPPRVRSSQDGRPSTLAGATKLVLAVALLCAVAFPFLKTGPGKVFTAALGHWGEPLPTATTVLDGEQRCTGARCAFEVSAGVHEITIKADGYVPQLQLVAVRSSEAAAVNFRLERGGSSLKVTGQPEGATLMVDGESVGKLPAQIDLTPGSHKLRFEAEHFLPEERDVELALGDAKHLGDVALRPMIGRATLDVRTPGAEVALVSGSERKDRLDVGQPIELDLSRKWTLEAKKWGYQILREPLDFGSGVEKTFVVALDKTGAPPGPGGVKKVVAAAAPAPAQHAAPAAAGGNSPEALRAAMQRAIERDVATPSSSDEDLPAAGPDRGPISNDPCLVSFNSIPVSNVFVDSVRIGVTPILKARVKPGSHVAQFSQGDTKKAKSFTCKPGELKVVAVSLNR
jgi:PEGA domain